MQPLKKMIFDIYITFLNTEIFKMIVSSWWIMVAIFPLHFFAYLKLPVTVYVIFIIEQSIFNA